MTPDRISLAARLLGRDEVDPELVLSALSNSGHAEMAQLLDVTIGDDDRFLISLDLIGLDHTLNVLCDFAEHALVGAAASRTFDWQIAEGKRNMELLTLLREYLGGVRKYRDLILDAWQDGWHYFPFPSPGLQSIARAAVTPENYARIGFFAAKEARQYLAWRKVGFRQRRQAYKGALAAEFTWQFDRLNELVQELLRGPSR